MYNEADKPRYTNRIHKDHSQMPAICYIWSVLLGPRAHVLLASACVARPIVVHFDLCNFHDAVLEWGSACPLRISITATRENQLWHNLRENANSDEGNYGRLTSNCSKASCLQWMGHSPSMFAAAYRQDRNPYDRGSNQLCTPGRQS